MSTPEFNTREIANPSDRAKHSKPIITNFPAADIPVGINMLDICHKCNPRIHAYIDNVSPADTNYDKFIGRINLDAWSDTRLFAAGCTWLDISKHSLDIQFGRFSTGGMNVTATTAKAVSIDIHFTRSYQVPPKVVIWLTTLDISGSYNTRLVTSVNNITTTGFKLKVETWDESVVYGATVSWIAVPSDNPIMTAGQLVSSYTGPSSGFQQKIVFDKPFKRVPRVMAAFNRLDTKCSINLRIKTYPKDITTEGMTLAIDTWDDSVIYPCGVAFIVIDDAPASKI